MDDSWLLQLQASVFGGEGKRAEWWGPWLFIIGGFMFSLLRWLFKEGKRCKTPRVQKDDADYTTKPTLDAAVKGTTTGDRYLVIGTGQVGLRIIDALVARGEKNVRAFDIVHPRRPYRAEGAQEVVQFVTGDITKVEDVKAACKDIDTIFLTAALIRYYERMDFQYQASHNVNVVGTENVIQACISNSVKNLVQTSTSNVCCSRENVKQFPVMDEKTPYITKETSPNHYGWTKVQAEQKVVAANGKSGLRTAALRPCSGVIGPDDAFLIEKSLTERQSTFIFTKPAIDYIFVDNLVYAHLLLEQKLRNNDSKVQGEIFCVSNNEPESLEQMTYLLQSVMEKKQLQPPLAVTYAPQGVLVVLAYMVEQAQYWTGNKIKGDLAFLTPAMFAIASLTYSFDCKKAEEILGYKPLYNMDEALQMTVDQWVEKQQILAEYWEKKDGGEKETKKKK